jgi:two-component system, OmpR family, response regulator
VVEDERRLAAGLRNGLAAEGFAVDVALDGTDGLWMAREHPYDAIVLDIMLPGVNGYRLCSTLRREGNWTPILMLTAKEGEWDEVEALDNGADDYLTKPFSYAVLLARLRALLRRAAGIATADIEIGKLRIDTRASRVTFDGNPVKLTSQEYRLLAYLAHHRGKVVSRTELVEHLYDQDFDRDSNTIEVFIGRLRKKLDAGLIQTVRGLGYSLEDPKLGGTSAEA